MSGKARDRLRPPPAPSSLKSPSCSSVEKSRGRTPAKELTFVLACACVVLVVMYAVSGSLVCVFALDFAVGALVMSVVFRKCVPLTQVFVERTREVEKRVECRAPCCLAERRLELSTAGDTLSMGYFETMGPGAKMPRSIVDIENEVTAPVAYRATRERDAS